MEDDDEVVLSDYAANMLKEFLAEKATKEALLSKPQALEDAYVDENWELSQFWYDEETANILANVAVEAATESGKIACVSSPTAFKEILKLKSKIGGCVLFEYDERFHDLFPEHFEFYDYNHPSDVKENLKLSFDIVIVDPPYLSRECLEKVVETIKLLTNKKIIICTGAVMEADIHELIGLKACEFRPRHANNLGNEFRCYANFDVDGFIPSKAAS